MATTDFFYYKVEIEEILHHSIEMKNHYSLFYCIIRNFSDASDLSGCTCYLSMLWFR